MAPVQTFMPRKGAAFKTLKQVFHHHHDQQLSEDYNQEKKTTAQRKPHSTSISPLLCYSHDTRESFKAENPTLSMLKLAKLITEEWNNLSPEERKKWEKKAKEERGRYEQEFKAYTTEGYKRVEFAKETKVVLEPEEIKDKPEKEDVKPKGLLGKFGYKGFHVHGVSPKK